MEREILFRGKRLDNGEWVYGVPLYYSAGQVGIVKCTSETRILPYDGDFEFHAIEELFSPKVDPATVGQYTGLTDKNGQKVFEDDIVRMSFSFAGCRPVVELSHVYFDNGSFCVNCGGVFNPYHRVRMDNLAPSITFEVIGNIHDNPELLEVQG